MEKATIQSIASKLELSVSTVSRALSGQGKKYRISPKTISLIQKTAKDLKYSPNSMAKGLRLKKSGIIGLVVPDIANPWFAGIAKEIEVVVRSIGHNLLLLSSNDILQVEKKSMTLLENWMVDGVIIAPIGSESDHILELRDRGIPIILIDRYFEDTKLPYIISNDSVASLEAISHLIANGHERIACFQGLPSSSSNLHRLNGYKLALKKHKIPFNEDWIIGNDYSFQNGYSCAYRFIQQLSREGITAVFSFGNQITLGALKAFKENGIRIPDDISMISFDNQNYSELLYTPMTTISHMQSGFGKLAIDMLLKAIEKVPFENVLLPATLIKRESVKRIN